MGGFLLTALLNLALLCLQGLCSPDSQRDGFLGWWSDKPVSFRAPIALFVIVTPIAFLLAEG